MGVIWTSDPKYHLGFPAKCPENLQWQIQGSCSKHGSGEYGLGALDDSDNKRKSNDQRIPVNGYQEMKSSITKHEVLFIDRGIFIFCLII